MTNKLQKQYGESINPNQQNMSSLDSLSNSNKSNEKFKRLRNREYENFSTPNQSKNNHYNQSSGQSNSGGGAAQFNQQPGPAAFSNYGAKTNSNQGSMYLNLPL